MEFRKSRTRILESQGPGRPVLRPRTAVPCSVATQNSALAASTTGCSPGYQFDNSYLAIPYGCYGVEYLPPTMPSTQRCPRRSRGATRLTSASTYTLTTSPAHRQYGGRGNSTARDCTWSARQ